MRRLIYVLVLCLASPLMAQELQQERCWIGSLSYSPGSTARASDRVMVCSEAFVWEPVEAAASGCVLEGKFYSTGAVDSGPRAGAQASICSEQGVWEQLAPSE